MKIFLSGLVVANLLLFGWLRGWMAPFGGDGRDPQRVGRQIEPQQLRVVQPPRPTGARGEAGGRPSAEPGRSGEGGRPADGARSADAVRGAEAGAAAGQGAAAIAGTSETAPAPVPAAALRAANCVEIGPMSESDAVRVQVGLDAVAADLAVATRRAEDITSWWVYLAPSPVELSRRLSDLRERGVTESYVMPDGIWKGAISLGLFRQEELAVALQRSIGARGVKGVRVAPRGPSAGRITLQVRPVGDAVLAELPRLRATMPEAVARPCGPRG